MLFKNNPFNLFTPQGAFKDRLKAFILDKSALNRLLLINIGVYVLFLIARLFCSIGVFLFQLEININDELIKLMSFPADFQSFLYHPWTIVTGIFFHASLSHIFFNMLMLYVAGKIFLKYLSNKQLWITYFVGGICGNLLYMLAYNVFPVFAEVVPIAVAMGASGAIMAILFAVAIYQPNHSLNLLFLGGIKLKWIALIFIVIDLLSIPSGNAGGHIAHLGGAIYGTLVALCLLFIHSRKSKPKTKKTKFYTSQQANTKPLSDAEFNAQKRKQEEKLDAILDKVARDGYPSLSKEEKDFLFFYRKK